MKKIYAIFLAVLLTASLFAQLPQKMSYQAVIRDDDNALVKSHAVGMRITILQDATPKYVETHATTTNANGLVTIEIGDGSVISGDFTTIDWSAGEYSIQTETDPLGGTNYTAIVGTSQLLSVPYALHAKTVASYPESDPVFITHPANGITGTNITNWTTAFGWGNHASAGYLTSFTELDPVFVAHAASGVTPTLIGNWNSAYGWGNHSGLYRPISYVPAWSEITSKPTTLVGFGITDAMNTSHAANTITSTNITNWNSAYDWGNHASAGYLTSYTETDPQVGANATDYLSKWDGTALVKSTIFDNGLVGIGTNSPEQVLHIKTTSPDGNIQLEVSEGDGYYIGYNGAGYMAISVRNGGTPYWDILNLKSGNVGVGTTNPSTKLDVNGIITSTGGNSNNWNSAYGWGNHSGLYRPIEYVPSWGEITGNPFIFITPTTDQLLKYNGSNWINFTPDFLTAEIDGSITNEIQDLTLTADKLKITNNASATEIDLAPYKADGSETLVTAGTNVTVTGAGTGASPYVINATGGGSTTYSVGDFAQGGIVFWIDETGQHGVVCAKQDQSTSVKWDAGTETNTMAMGDGPLSGETNTAIIIANQGYGDGIAYAARICNELQITEGGKTYGDWYLPSRIELNLMDQNREIINATATANGGTIFTDAGYYWSSTEKQTNSAWVVWFSHDYQTNANKGQYWILRAVRSF